MVLIKESKVKYFIHGKVDKEIASMTLEEFFDNLSCIEKDVV